jgi:hypothetical protein
MTEPDNFLTRWSRRKRAAAKEAAPQQPHQTEQTEEGRAEQKETIASAPNAAQETAAPFDPASLPAIESIGANSDVTAFLRPGVPPELTRAALRRAWSSDPAIRDFVGLVENGWDFNNPEAMPGFGRIEPAEVARLVAQTVGGLSGESTKQPSEPSKAGKLTADGEAHAPMDNASSLARAEPTDVHCNETDGALRDKA